MRSLRFDTTSQRPVTVTAYDSITGKRIKINNQDYVSITPSRQSATPTTLTVTSVGMVLYKCIFHLQLSRFAYYFTQYRATGFATSFSNYGGRIKLY